MNGIAESGSSRQRRGRVPVQIQRLRRTVPKLRRSNAKGVPSPSPGFARGTSAYPGLSSHIFPNNPNGVASSGFVRRGRNPDGVLESHGIVPRAAAPSSRQPWAPRRNALGVHRSWRKSSASIAEQNRASQCRLNDSSLRFRKL